MSRPRNQTRGLSKLIIIIILGSIAIIIGTVVLVIIQSRGTPAPKTITLNVWGVWDDSSDLSNITAAYTKAHPYVKIAYTKKRYEEYEKALVEGWATDSGPDIYAIPSTWINKYKGSFITPLPKSTNVAFFKTQKYIFKNETQIKYIVEPALTSADIKRNFIDVVNDDIVINNKIYGLPFGINTLVMYYNRELLNIAHVTQPPATWNEFATLISKIAIVDEQNNITRAGTALGTYDNVPYAADLVSLLMLQNGTAMTTGNKITMTSHSATDPSYYPAEEALRFYTDFATPEKAVYTWNAQMPNALDYFAEGKLAFYFGYKFQEPELKLKSRGVDYGIAAVPQVSPDNEVNYANYWVYTVSKKAKAVNEAWHFLQYAASASRNKTYLAKTQQASVLRSTLNEQLKNPDLELYANQALTTKSWYHGQDPQGADTQFSEMIQAVVNKSLDIKAAITLAEKKIQQGY